MWHDVLSKLLIAAATHDIGSMVVGAEIAHHSWDHYKRKLTDEHMAKGGKYADWPICKYMGLDKSSMETIGVLGLGLIYSSHLTLTSYHLQAFRYRASPVRPWSNGALPLVRLVRMAKWPV